MAPQPISTAYAFGSQIETHTLEHIKYAIFIPRQIHESKKLSPTIYYLPGLTCTQETFFVKCINAVEWASKEGVILVSVDTSPRDDEKEGEGEDDLGSGAGFYVDATQPQWQKRHYNMYTFVSKTLPEHIEKNFPSDPNRCSIFGHSMGGHGALVIGLRNQEKFKSISAFAPICNPSNAPWGIKAFTNYLGKKEDGNWAQYDAAEVLKAHPPQNKILIDQGTDDQFYKNKQLLPETLKHKNIALRMLDGYQHGYFFVASCIQEHLIFHLFMLKQCK